MAEHNLINPHGVDLYIRPFVTRCKVEAGKAWLQKKLRALLINDARYLTVLSADDLALSTMPDYLTQAAERGDTIYQFTPDGPALDKLTQAMNHVVDWFNALGNVVSRRATSPVAIEDKAVAQKWLDKLPKIALGEITNVADTWFANLGSRVSVDKAGTVSEITWPDGFYAVRFTDKATMMADGKTLQNCLGSGTYWDRVQAHRAAIYAIRKPNDEPVAGIMVTTGQGRATLDQCKGKQNQAVTPAYVPYVVDFMKQMDIDVGAALDLKAAGIEVHDGQIGRFKDFAEVTYDQDGIKIWQTRSRFEATMPEGKIIGQFGPDRTITSIGVFNHNNEALTLSQYLLTVLNILGNAPAATVGRTLSAKGIFYHNGRYGDAKEIGEKRFTVSRYSGYQVSQKTTGGADYTAVLLYADDNSYAGRMVIAGNGHLSGIEVLSRWEVKQDGAPNPDLIAMLNALGAPPEFDFEKILGHRYGIYFDQTYGPLAQVAKPDISAGNVQILRFGKRHVWLMTCADARGTMRFWLKGKRLEGDSYPDWLGSDQGALHGSSAVRQLALKYKVRSVDGAATFGMLNDPHGLVADLPTWIATASQTDGLAYVGDRYAYGNISHPLLDSAVKMFQGHLTPEQQQQIYDVLKPPDEGLRTTREADTIYDIEVPTIILTFACANSTMIRHGVLTNKKVIAMVAADNAKILKAALKLVSGEPYGFVSIANLQFVPEKNRPALAVLQDSIDTLRQQTDAAVRERRQNPDKYATDLSGRFAAMNAFRKRY